MITLNLGDPGQGTTPFTLPSIEPRGNLLILNESPYGLNFYFGGQPLLVPAESYRVIQSGYLETGMVKWEIAYTLSIGNSPISLCVVECYECGEQVQASIRSLPRQTNIGNAVPVGTQTTSVVNDGNAAPTQVVEATPTGATGSHLLWNNDGSGTFGGARATVDNHGIFTLPAGAIPVASIGAGALPSGVTLPAGQVSAGTLPGGVLIAAGQVSGTVSAAANAGQLASALTATDDGTNGNLFPVNNNRTTVLYGRDSGGVNHAALGALTNGDSYVYGGAGFASGGSLHAIAAISGSGSATVTHGLSVTPDAALVNTANGSNSTTFGSGSYTSSSVFIYQFNSQPWRGMVYKA